MPRGWPRTPKSADLRRAGERRRRSTVTASRRTVAAPTAVDVEHQRRRELPARGGALGDADRRVRDVRARRQTPPRLHPRPHRHRRVDVDHLGATVVGMATRCDIPTPEVLAVEHPDDAVRATTSGGPRRGRRRTARRRRRRRGAHRAGRVASSARRGRRRACDADRRSPPPAAPSSRRRRARPARRRSRRRRVRRAGRPVHPSRRPCAWSRHDRHRSDHR